MLVKSYCTQTHTVFQLCLNKIERKIYIYFVYDTLYYSVVRLFIHPCLKYLSSGYYLSDIILGAGGTQSMPSEKRGL